MPRSSLAEQVLERGWSSGHGSIGRVSQDVHSVGSNTTRHWIDSVSDIYGPDEIEELLDDLNRLELAGLESANEDFDIDGSHVCVGVGGRTKQTSKNINNSSTDRAGSPTFSIASWDSHAIYQRQPGREEFEICEPGSGRDPENPDSAAFNNPSSTSKAPRNPSSRRRVLCFCDIKSLVTPGAILRIFLLMTSIACLCAMFATSAAGFYEMPHFHKLRILMFTCIFTIFFTTFVLVTNISHFHLLMPFDFGKMQTVVYLTLTLAYIVLSLLMILLDDWRIKDPDATDFFQRNHPLILTVLSLCCGFETFLCIFNCGPNRKSEYDKMLQESSTHFTLQETASSSQNNPASAVAGAARRQGLSCRPTAKSGDKPVSSGHLLAVTTPKHEDDDAESTYYSKERVKSRKIMKASVPPPTSSASATCLLNENDDFNQQPLIIAENNQDTGVQKASSSPRQQKAKMKTKMQPHQQQQQRPPSTPSKPVKSVAIATAKSTKSASSSSSSSTSSSCSSESSSGEDESSSASSCCSSCPLKKQRSKEEESVVIAAAGKTRTTRALVTCSEDAVAASASDPDNRPSNRTNSSSSSTGAIPKQKKNVPEHKKPSNPIPSTKTSTYPGSHRKASTNHLDEIIAIPIEDLSGDPVTAATAARKLAYRSDQKRKDNY